jgi:hypothetical protein
LPYGAVNNEAHWLTNAAKCMSQYSWPPVTHSDALGKPALMKTGYSEAVSATNAKESTAHLFTCLTTPCLAGKR